MAMDDLIQGMDCPFGKGKVIMVEKKEKGLYGRCLVAAEARRQEGFFSSFEEDLKRAGCPKYNRGGLFGLSQCRYNSGHEEKI